MFQNSCSHYHQRLQHSLEETARQNQLLLQQRNNLCEQISQLSNENRILCGEVCKTRYYYYNVHQTKAGLRQELSLKKKEIENQAKKIQQQAMVIVELEKKLATLVEKSSKLPVPENKLIATVTFFQQDYFRADQNPEALSQSTNLFNTN